MVLTSVTPGTVRSCGRITQSWIVRRSIGVYGRAVARLVAPGSASTVHMKISPRPVAIGPIAGSTPGGSALARLLQPLAHQLAREVDVGAVLEDRR